MKEDADLRPVVDVSVVTPAYNAAATIERALFSVFAQTVRPREVIVVDDGSDDGTPEIAVAFAAASNGIPVKVLRQSNMGAGAARNWALREAVGEFVAFLDSDDEWLPKKLEFSLRELTARGLALVAHNGWVIEGDQRIPNDIALRYRLWKDAIFDGLYRRGFISTSSVVADRDIVLACGGFDEDLRAGQDFDLWLKLCHRTNGNLAIFDWELTQYHVRPNSISRNTELRLKCCIEIAIRYFPVLLSCAPSPFFSLWFRVSALFHEAFVAYTRRRAYWQALLVAIRYPVCLIDLTCRALGNSNSDAAPLAKSSRWQAYILYGWMLSVMVLYLAQFRSLLHTIVNRFIS